jgi:transposase-like protein
MPRHELSRLKHKRIRCPDCEGTSTQTGKLNKTLQIRVCNKCKKEFVYDYQREYIRQQRWNWNMKIVDGWLIIWTLIKLMIDGT